MLGLLVHANALRCMIIFILVFSPYIAANGNHGELRPIGCIVDYLSGNGKEERIAMEMAIEDCCAYTPLHCGFALHFMNSGNDPLTAASSGKISSSFQFRTFKYHYFYQQEKKKTSFAAFIMRFAAWNLNFRDFCQMTNIHIFHVRIFSKYETI